MCYFSRLPGWWLKAPHFPLPSMMIGGDGGVPVPSGEAGGVLLFLEKISRLF